MAQSTLFIDRDLLLNDQDAFEADATAQTGTLPASPAAEPKLTPPSPLSTTASEAPPASAPDSGPQSAATSRQDESQADDSGADETGFDQTIADAPPREPEEAAAELTQPLFSDTGLSEPILRAIAEKGYLHPTPIQAQAIPVVLAGRDVLGVAQTGTGKTASFVLPMMDILDGSRARARMPRSLILEPTRELALQVAENFVLYGKHLKLNHALLIGGESLNDQKAALMKGVDVLIATPGRLLDLFERGGLMLTDCRVLVIDEADRMLDMGFIPDVEKIVGFLPKTRQTLFFSATMSPEIGRLTDAFLQNPKMITVSKSATVATTIIAGLALTAEHDKREALRRLIRSEDVQNALIFCNRKRDVDILYKSLQKHGFSVGALHGDMPQPSRFATLEKFKANEIRLLVCSDVAARGIDIGGLSHVFNFDVPHHAEDYVHRSGRTGRAGRAGHAFTLAGPEDRLAVEAIEKLTGAPIPRIVVPGLDVVEWAETDGRKRRGRSGSSASSSRDRAPRDGASRDGGKPKADPRSSRAPDKPRAEPAQAAPKPADRSRDRAPRPDTVAARDEAPRARAPEPVRSEARFDRAPRERRWRDDDLGPSVTGFGDEVPAFMLLPKRGVRVQDEAA
jgi:superfamily II DNA/RNA helicase